MVFLKEKRCYLLNKARNLGSGLSPNQTFEKLESKHISAFLQWIETCAKNSTDLVLHQKALHWKGWTRIFFIEKGVKKEALGRAVFLLLLTFSTRNMEFPLPKIKNLKLKLQKYKKKVFKPLITPFTTLKYFWSTIWL